MLNFANVHDLLQSAANDAKVAYEYNLHLPNHMRISRVGQPLVSLLLEDFVFSRLPNIAPVKVLSEKARNQDKVKRTMAQATGYIFEQVVIDILKQNPLLEVMPQHRVKLGSLSGTCDILVVNTLEARATVVECKALKYGTKKDACAQALFNDSSTGYLSQLAIYRQAVQQEYGLYDVDAYWMVWCKESASLFKVAFDESGTNYNELEKEALQKCHEYSVFELAAELKNFGYCLNALDLNRLPLKKPYYSGFAPACPIHYSPWSKLLLDEDGQPWEDADENLSLMLKVSLENDGQAAETLLKLLQEH